jgi:hypothetical protein
MVLAFVLVIFLWTEFNSSSSFVKCQVQNGLLPQVHQSLLGSLQLSWLIPHFTWLYQMSRQWRCWSLCLCVKSKCCYAVAFPLVATLAVSTWGSLGVCGESTSDPWSNQSRTAICFVTVMTVVSSPSDRKHTGATDRKGEGMEDSPGSKGPVGGLASSLEKGELLPWHSQQFSGRKPSHRSRGHLHQSCVGISGPTPTPVGWPLAQSPWWYSVRMSQGTFMAEMGQPEF